MTTYIIQDKDTRLYFGHHDRWVKSKDRAITYTSKVYVDRLVDFFHKHTKKKLIIKTIA